MPVYFTAAIVLAVLIVPFVLGAYLSKRWRMPDYFLKISLVLFSLIAGATISYFGWPPKLGIDLRGGVILVYEISKVFHLPSLIFILVFGLFLNNLEKIKHIGFVQKLKPSVLHLEVNKFQEITIEATFLVRALFFLLFGYLIETSELIDTDTLAWSVGITAAIFLVRVLILKAAKMPLAPLAFVAPRGLITILLFLSLTPQLRIPLINRPNIIQVIILSALVLMVGALLNKRPVNEDVVAKYPG